MTDVYQKFHDEPPRSAAMVYGDAYKLCASIRALNASNHLCVETGAIERLTQQLNRHATILGIDTANLWLKYDTYATDRENQRAESSIEVGAYDVAVVKRSARLKQMAEAQQRLQDSPLVKGLNAQYKHYPFHERTSHRAAPKRNVAAVTVHNGHVQNVMFNEDHGLLDGIHALVVA